MIINASQRGGAKQLAQHLLRTDENEHVEVHEIRGFVSDDVTGALKEAYAVSKGALLALTRALAIEFAPEVRVNALLPGAVNTPMLQAGLQRGHLTGENMDDLLSDLGNKTIMGRVGEPKEIANAIMFLGGDRSSFMTGQSLVVDGGALTRLSTE